MASLAEMLGGEARPAAEVGALAAPEPAAPGAAAAAAPLAADVAMEEAAAAQAVDAAPAEAAPVLLLEVFEDRAPAAPAAAAAETAPPPAAGPSAAATAAVTQPAGAEEADELAALRELIQRLPPSQARRERRRLAVAELTGRPLSEVKRMSKGQLARLRKQARQQGAAGAKHEKKLSAKQRRAAAATAQAALDRLFEAALGGDAAAWAAACAGLSQEEREALALREVDLEDYRRQIAAAAKLPGADSTLQGAAAADDGDGGSEGEEAGGPAAAPSGSDWEPGSSEEEGASSEDESMGPGSEEEEAAAAAVEAAAAAHGGHYLRSCNAEAAAAAAGVPAAPGGADEAQWFWERQQARQRHAEQQQQQGRAERRQQGPAQPLSPLHHEVKEFAELARPTPQEVRHPSSLQRALQLVWAPWERLTPPLATLLANPRCRLPRLPAWFLSALDLGCHQVHACAPVLALGGAGVWAWGVLPL